MRNGPTPSKKEILGIRELTRDDLEHLREKKPVHIVQRLRDPHHLLARLLATGLRLVDAAQRAGYSYARAVQLRKDPAFEQLIADYRREVHANWIDTVDEFAQTSVSNMMKAERMIAERLEEAEEEGKLPALKELAAITADRADRFGYGKKQTNVNVNVDFAAQLERAVRRSSAVSTPPALVEHRPSSSHHVQAGAPTHSADGPIRRRA